MMNHKEALNKLLPLIFYSNKSSTEYKIIRNTSRIRDLLALLNNDDCCMEVKYDVLKTMHHAFSSIRHYIEIFNKATIDYEGMDLYRILIRQYVLCIDKSDDGLVGKYQAMIIGILELMVSNVTCQYKVFEYIFSLFLPYLSKNIESDVEKLSTKRLKEYIALLSLLYGERCIKETPYEYFYFSGEGEMTMTPNAVNYNDSYAIFTWFKIGINKEDIKSIFSKSDCHLISIDYRIIITLDLNHILRSTSDPSLEIALEENKWYLLTLSWKSTAKGINSSIYLNGDLKSSTAVSLNKDSVITAISFYRNFIGEVTTIMLIKGDKYPSLFSVFKNKRFKHGIKSEKGLIMFNKTINNDVYSQHNSDVIQHIARLNIKEDFPNVEDVKVLYMPNRHEEESELIVTVKDSYCDARLEMSSRHFNGVYIHQRHHKNISMIDGLYNLLPLMEMIGISASPLNTYPLLGNVLTKEIIDDLCLFILVIKGNLSKKGANEEVIAFTQFLGLFLEKLPAKFFKGKMFNYFKTLFISQDLRMITSNGEEISLYDEICLRIFLNAKVYFKFDKENQRKIWPIVDSGFFVYRRLGMITICEILLEIDKERYVKHCCVDHARVFKEDDEEEIATSDVLVEITPMENCIRGIIHEKHEEIKVFYGLLLKEISPCLQVFIIRTTSAVFNKNFNRDVYDILCKEDFFINVTLFALSTALVDIRYDILDLFLLIVDKNPSFKFTEEQSLFFENSLLPIYTLINSAPENERDINIIKEAYTLKSIIEEDNTAINDIPARQDSDKTSGLSSFILLQENDTSSKVSEIPIKPQGKDSGIAFSPNELLRLKEAYFPQELNQDCKMLKPSGYMKISPTPRQEFLTKYLNEDKFKESLLKIFAFLHLLLPYEPLSHVALNSIIKLSPLIDLHSNYSFLQLSAIDTFFSTMADSPRFYQWLLDIALQCHITKDPQLKGALIIHSNSPTDIDAFLKESIDLHTRICMTHSDRLDFFMTWCNYYKTLYDNDPLYKHNLERFIYSIFYNLLAKQTDDMKGLEKPDINPATNQFLFCFSILFEYLVIYRLDKHFTVGFSQSFGFDSQSVKVPLYYSEIFDGGDDGKVRKLEEKWGEWVLFDLLTSLSFIIYNKAIDYAKVHDSYSKYVNDSNDLLPQLKVLMYDTQSNGRNVNEGIPLMLVLVNLMSMVINEIETEKEMDTWLRKYSDFITFVIIASMTVNPMVEEYSVIQDKVMDVIGFGFCFLIQQSSCLSKKTVLRSKNIKVLLKLFALVTNICSLITKAIETKGQKKKQYFKPKNNASSNKGDCAVYKLFNGIAKVNDKSILEQFNLSKCTEEQLKEIMLDEKFKKALLTNPRLSLAVDKLFAFPVICRGRKEKIKAIIPHYVTYCAYQSTSTPSIRLDCNYIESAYYPAHESIFNKAIDHRNELNEIIAIHAKEKDFISHQLVNDYRRLKERLFSFKGLWSNKKVFYTDKGSMKYKVMNHMTKDYSRPLLYPVIDYEYYIPEFSRFEKKKMFYRKDINHQHVEIDTCKYFTQPAFSHQASHRLNILHRINQSIFIPEYMSPDNTDYSLFRDFIKTRLVSSSKTETSMLVLCNLMKPTYHIRGLFCNDKEGIKFYAYEWPSNSIEEQYDEHKQYGNFFKTPMKKQQYHLFIPYNQIARLMKRKAFHKSSLLELYTVFNKSYTFQLWSEIDRNGLLGNIASHFPREVIGFKGNKALGYENIGHMFIGKNTAGCTGALSLGKRVDQWINWEISTLEFIMSINLIANRSFNDMLQYPIFPWIITDYTMNYHPLDLPLRDLTLPMGMLELNEDAVYRKKAFINKYETMLSDQKRKTNDETPYVFGTHYSNSMYVSYYLMRLFPYSHLKIEMQGNSFDNPNRLFNSLQLSFLTASTHNSDLRELVPEFFFLPEAFENINDFDFGEIEEEKSRVMQRIQSVQLPPWCGNDSCDFIAKHRRVLEGGEVSKGINGWIDVIFGVKQRLVVKDKFYNLYREECYDCFEETFNGIEDKEHKQTMCRMVEFGVCPNQIFSSAVSKRKAVDDVLSVSSGNMTFKIDDKCKRLIESPDNEENLLLIKALTEESKMLLISNDIVIEMEINEKLNTYDYRDLYELKESSIKMAMITRRNLSTNLIVYDKGHCILKGGYFNGQLYSHYSTKQMALLLYYNQCDMSPIVSMAIDKEESFVYCGTMSGKVHIYFIAGLHSPIDLSLYKTINDQRAAITALYANSQLNVLATVASDGFIMLYTVPRCKLFNSIQVPSSMHINYLFVASAPLPCLVYYDQNSLAWYCNSINGKALGTLEMGSAVINAKMFTDCFFMEYIVFTTEKEEIGVMSLPDLSFKLRHEAFKHIINIDVSNERSCYYVLEEIEDSYRIVVLKHDSEGLISAKKDKNAND